MLKGISSKKIYLMFMFCESNHNHNDQASHLPLTFEISRLCMMHEMHMVR